MHLHTIEPEEPNQAAEAVKLLIDGGWSESAASWLSACLLKIASLSPEPCFEGWELGLRARQLFTAAAGAKSCLGNEAASLLFAAWFVPRVGEHPVLEAPWKAVLEAAAARGFDMRGGLLRLAAPQVSENAVFKKNPGIKSVLRSGHLPLVQLARLLAEWKLINPRGIIDPDLPNRGFEGDEWYSGGRSADTDEAETREVAAPIFWLLATEGEASAAYTDLVVESPVDVRLRYARGFGRAMSSWLWRRGPGGLGAHPEWFFDLPNVARVAATRVFKSIDNESLFSGDPAWRPVWLRLARIAFEQRGHSLGEEERRPILKVAADQIGRMRPLLRRAETSEARSAFEGQPMRAVFNDCCFLLFEMGSLWDAWKPLLLAFRALNAPSLSPTLSFVDNASHIWSIIPSSIVMLFHHHVRREQAQDPTLAALRSGFARFCLESLKSTKRNSPDRKEPDAHWRYCYVRAARELRINPDGDGHRVLDWVADNDPHDEVREAAEIARKDIRKGDHLDGRPPRELVIRAFWWLQQAHMLALQQEIDPSGAQRTREWMIRRTTEEKPREHEY